MSDLKLRTKIFVKNLLRNLGFEVQFARPKAVALPAKTIALKAKRGPISELMADASSNGRLRDEVESTQSYIDALVAHLIEHGCSIQTIFSDSSALQHIAFKYLDRRHIINTVKKFNFNNVEVRFFPEISVNEHKKPHSFYFRNATRSFVSKVYAMDPWLSDDERMYSNSKNNFVSTIPSFFINRTVWSVHPHVLRAENNPDVSLSRAFETQESMQHKPDFPVDAVYTWVDGDDPQWRLSREQYAPSAYGHVENVSDARFRNSNELLYSLRSLAANAPFIRNIYVVTSGQIPALINFGGRIRLVSHQEIFEDSSDLPTFNSHAIETNLHRIDGLSENFLYLNDDMFFWSKCFQNDFFHTNGLGKSFLENIPAVSGDILTDTPGWRAAAINGNRLINERFGKVLNNFHLHTPYALKRSVMREMWDVYNIDMRKTSGSKFRNSSDLSPTSFLYHAHSYCTKHSVFSSISNRRVTTAHPDFPAVMEGLMQDFELKVVCINDGDTEHAQGNHVLMSALQERRFPIKAAWEAIF